MKKSKIFLGLLAAVLMSSCTDMLEKEPLTSNVNNSLFWENVDNLEAYANAFYNQFVGYNGKFYTTTMTDDQVTSGFKTWTYINVPASSSNWTGHQQYQQICEQC